uniref:Uncharacterized protein n=1 Tax=Rhizophora mucronata TaxID=61149 RepID=A0A2P2NF68_RHIMU
MEKNMYRISSNKK